MTQSQTGIKVKDLQSVSTLSNTASILALTDATNNTVNLVSKNDFSGSLVSTTADNGLTNDENGLFVPNIGNLADLDTNDKTSVVNAINSLNAVTTLATSGTIALSDNSINSITPTASVTFTLPTVTDNTTFHQILVQAKLTNNVYISAGRIGTTYYFSKEAPAFDTSGLYNIYYEFDNVEQVWVCGVLSKGTIN